MTDRALVYRVSLAGQSEFTRDYRGLQDMIRRSADDDVKLEKMVAARKKGTRDESARHSASLLKTQIALEKARARESVREAERSEREKQRATEKSEREKTKIAQREAKTREKGERDHSRTSIRQQQEELRAFEKNEREKTKIAQREMRARQREEQATQAFANRSSANSSRFMFRQRDAEQRRMSRDSDRHQRDVMFDHKRLYRGIATGVVEGGANALGAAYGMASGMGRSVLTGMGAQNAWNIADIVDERLTGQRMMRSVAIEARLAGQGMGSGAKPFNEKDALEKVRRISRTSGISQRDLFQAIDAASEKGSGADAVDNLDRIATQANAMGTDATTVSKLRAQIKMSSKVGGKELGDDAIDKLVAKMHFVGKTGVFRAEDLAKESESLFSQFTKSGMDFETGFDRYIAFSNEARKATGSGAMARTSINAVQDAIAKKEGKVNALGVKTRNADGSNRDFIDVVMDSIEKTGGEGKAFTQIFDPSKSGKAISTMISAFNAGGGRKDAALGRAAMQKMLSGDESLKDATVAEMNKDAALRLDDPSAKIATSIETIRQALADKLGPALDKLAANAPQIAATIGKALDFVVAHPALVGGAVLMGSGGGGAAKPMAGAALRFVGDSLANIMPGGGGGALAKSVSGAIASSTSTPVFVTGVATGVSLGGGGGLPSMGGAGSALGGAGGMGGGAGVAAGAGILGTVAAVAALGYVVTKAGIAIYDMYTETEHFKKALAETSEKSLKAFDLKHDAVNAKPTEDKFFATLNGRVGDGSVLVAGSKTHGTKGGKVSAAATSRADLIARDGQEVSDDVNASMWSEALAFKGPKSDERKGAATGLSSTFDKATGTTSTGTVTAVGAGAEFQKDLKKADGLAEAHAAGQSLAKTFADLDTNLRNLNANVSAFKVGGGRM